MIRSTVVKSQRIMTLRQYTILPSVIHSMSRRHIGLFSHHFLSYLFYLYNLYKNIITISTMEG